MIPISGVSAGAVQPLAAAGKTSGASGVREPQEEPRRRPQQPVMDEYRPEEPREPSGRYWVGRDEEGQPKVYFDDPDQAAEGEKPAQADERAAGPERKDSESQEKCACNTDKVDREIEKLKKRQAELEQQLRAETDEAKRKLLQRQLDQVSQELKRKDTDAYRQQHAVFTKLS